MNKLLPNYQILIPPLKRDISMINEAEAKEYFDWYLTQCPARTSYLLQQIGYTGDSFNQIVYTPESLKVVWAWFHDVVAAYDQEKENRKAVLLKEYIIRDIGMYLGETFTHNFSTLRWNYFTQPKNDFFVNTPGITGFYDRKFTPPFPMFFEPIHMTGVQAAKIAQGRARHSDLYDLYVKWADKV